MPTKAEKMAAAMAQPPQRPRRDTANIPVPPGRESGQNVAPTPAATAVPPQPQTPPVPEITTPEPAAAPDVAESQTSTPDAETKPEPPVKASAAAPAKAKPQTPSSRREPAPLPPKAAAPRVTTSGPSDVARARLALRTAEQTFLPLVSRVAKLREWSEQAVLAVVDAKEAGVIGEDLENTLRGITSKNKTRYVDIPESVRDAIQDDEDSEPVSANDARARLAARTAEQTFLPLVSRVAKLREWSEQAVLAVVDAKAQGIEADELEDTLRAIARKNKTRYTDIPESVRSAIADD